MNKHKRLLLILMAGFVLLLQNCKHDDPDPVEPDSNYVGTPDTIQRPFKFPSVVIPDGITLTKEGVQLGRMLFYDMRLSSDSTVSCASCHKQEFAFSDGGKPLSKNVFGVFTKRNTPPIFNMVWLSNYFWDGRATALTAQAADALQHEQNFISVNAIPKLEANAEYVRLFKKAFGRPGDITEEKIHKALAMFMMKLVSSESRFDSVMRFQANFTADESHGFYDLFTQDPVLNQTNPGVGADCIHCHVSTSGSYFTFIDNSFHNNALQVSNGFQFPDNGRGDVTGNQQQNGVMRTPHMRNIEVTGPYMHDGRFTDLRQVINFYNDSLKSSPTVDPNMKFVGQGGLHTLSEADKDALLAFLKTLTDHHFLTDTAFSNPFQ